MNFKIPILNLRKNIEVRINSFIIIKHDSWIWLKFIKNPWINPINKFFNPTKIKFLIWSFYNFNLLIFYLFFLLFFLFDELEIENIKF
jgi:hypothetical protein